MFADILILCCLLCAVRPAWTQSREKQFTKGTEEELMQIKKMLEENHKASLEATQAIATSLDNLKATLAAMASSLSQIAGNSSIATASPIQTQQNFILFAPHLQIPKR